MAILGINLNDVQPLLVSGINIKTINGTTLLGSGDLAISASASWGDIGGNIADQTDLVTAFNNVYLAIDDKQDTLVNQVNIRSINGTSLLGSGDLTVSASISIGTAIGSATAGSVLFAGALGVLAQDNTNFFWDDANNRLGIGTSSPGAEFQVNSTGSKIQIGNPAFWGLSGIWQDNANTVLNFGTRSQSAGGNVFAFYGDSGVGSMLLYKIGTLDYSFEGFSERVSLGRSSALWKNFYAKAGNILIGSAADVGFLIKGTTAQSGNILETRDVSNNLMLTVTANGGLRLASYTVAGLPASPTFGEKYLVTDASGAAVVGSIVVGGGATRVEVVWAYGGAGWKITARY